ncbi:MAG: hypothetical protein H6585_14450 [Flavobacteriales bacterium]|nr:hypothetical protein [Flavobacteriales bacterium]MCB9449530.1 hypothetical protein [Flavobacteriales bacterium]
MAKYAFMFFLLLGVSSKGMCDDGWRPETLQDTLIDSISYKIIDRFDNGTVSAIGNYDDEGDKIGKWWYYRSDGSLKMSGLYKNGKKDGPWLLTPYTLEYYESGKLRKKKVINPGQTY